MTAESAQIELPAPHERRAHGPWSDLYRTGLVEGIRPERPLRVDRRRHGIQFVTRDPRTI